jgi:hypothetical protein
LSYAKFAPITGTLLARKGEAMPSLGAKRSFGWAHDTLPVRDTTPAKEVYREIPPAPTTQIAPPEPARFPMPVEEIHVAAPKPHSVFEKPRRIVVSFTAAEFERLGIAAVKKGISRHDLVRDTMDGFLKRFAADLSAPCACLNGGEGNCCNGAGHTA